MHYAVSLAYIFLHSTFSFRTSYTMCIKQITIICTELRTDIGV